MLLEKNVHKDPALRWLHLTDLHVGKNNELQATALTNLIEAIKKESGDLVFDLVILSGDLAYSGQELEYEKLEQLIINPLKNTEAFRHSKFIATPGNHDMDCEIGLPVIWEQIGSGRRDSFFQLGDVGKKTRSSRAEAFKNYSSFLARNGILGVDPTVEPARAERITVRGLEVMLISAVTSFFSDKDVSDEEISPAPVHPLPRRCTRPPRHLRPSSTIAKAPSAHPVAH